MAASGPVVAREVVQPLPPAGTDALNAALQRLATNPRDAGALVDAGFAALDIGDVDAAVGFFSRADAVDPGNARAQAGLGAAYVRSENPYDALLMFEEAEKAGAASVTMAGDRGLAFDLVGDSSSAQMYYRKALALGPNPEVTRRLAVSLAISGDRNGAEAALLPLLKKQDLAAYRARAFVLAIMGDAKGAQEIADQVMPREMAGKIAPYLRYMPRLTAAQQAAAANFGQFPRAADIGKDDPRIAKYSGNSKRPQVASAAPVASSQSPLVPAGEPFGRKVESEKPVKATKRSERDRRNERQVAAAAPAAPPAARAAQAVRATETGASVAQSSVAAPVAAAPAPARALSTVRVTETGELPSIAQTSAANQPSAPPRTAMAASSPVGVPAAVTAPASSYAPAPAAPVGEAAIASFDNRPQVPPASPASSLPAAPPDRALIGPVDAPVSTGAVAAATPMPAQPLASAAPAAALATVPSVPAAVPQAEPVPQRLAEVFADFTLPAAAPRAPGAVDITRITPRREAPPPKEAQEDTKALPKDTKATQKDAKAQQDAKAKKETKPKPPAHPSRSWVQVATGRDIKALGFDWRRITRAQAELFKGRQPYVAKWGQTNRLLTGPFPNAAAAQDYVSRLKKAGVDSFTFTSNEGEDVTTLPAGR